MPVMVCFRPLGLLLAVTQYNVRAYNIVSKNTLKIKKTQRINWLIKIIYPFN